MSLIWTGEPRERCKWSWIPHTHEEKMHAWRWHHQWSELVAWAIFLAAGYILAKCLL